MRVTSSGKRLWMDEKRGARREASVERDKEKAMERVSDELSVEGWYLCVCVAFHVVSALFDSYLPLSSTGNLASGPHR